MSCQLPTTRCSVVVQDSFDLFKTQCFLPVSCGSDLVSYKPQDTFVQQTLVCFRRAAVAETTAQTIRAVQFRSRLFMGRRRLSHDIDRRLSDLLFVDVNGRVEVRHRDAACNGYVPQHLLCKGSAGVSFTHIDRHMSVLGTFSSVEEALGSLPLLVNVELEDNYALVCSSPRLRSASLCYDVHPSPITSTTAIHVNSTTFFNSRGFQTYNSPRQCNVPLSHVTEAFGSQSIIRGLLSVLETIISVFLDQVVVIFEDLFGTLENLFDGLLALVLRLVLFVSERIVASASGSALVAGFVAFYASVAFDLQYVWCYTLAALVAVLDFFALSDY